MRAAIARKFDFDAAHFLPNYKGKCHNMHGHHWVIQVVISGEVDKKSGMVLDFTVLKGIMEEKLLTLDHCLVNDQVPNPTAENLATFIYRWLIEETSIPWEDSPHNLELESVRVWESEDSWAMVTDYE